MCPNAFAVVLSGEKTFVACTELANNDDVPGWKGFKDFGTKNGVTSLEHAAAWIHAADRFVDPLSRPMFLLGYESMIRSFSPRFFDRVLSHLFAHLKKAKNTDCARQLNARANGAGVPAQLIENGLESCITFSTGGDFATFKSHHPYTLSILKYATAKHVSMEHVFDGGEPGKAMGTEAFGMKYAVRSHFCKAVSALGNPIGDIVISPAAGPGLAAQCAAEEVLAEKNAALVRAAMMLRSHAAAAENIAMDIDDELAPLIQVPTRQHVNAESFRTSAHKFLYFAHVATTRFGPILKLHMLHQDAIAIEMRTHNTISRLVTQGLLSGGRGEFSLTDAGKAFVNVVLQT
jgi:hypothetical protein